MNAFARLVLAVLIGLGFGAGLIVQQSHAAGDLRPSDYFHPDAATQSHPAQLFQTNCASCHLKGVAQAPTVNILGFMSPKSIYDALTIGPMRGAAARLSSADRVELAEYISGKKMSAARETTSPPRCDPEASSFDLNQPPPFAQTGFDASNRHFVPPAIAGVSQANVSRLQLKWTLGFPDSVRLRSQPALGGGGVYVGGQDGTLYALDRKSGCLRWRFNAGVEVRTGIVISPWSKGDRAARPMLFFGDILGRIYALDARSGAVIWSARADNHPSTTLTAAPALAEGVLYVPVSSLEESALDPTYECCTFRGSVVAYEAATGKRLWQTFTGRAPEPQGVTATGVRKYGPSGAAVWNTPTVDMKRHRIYFGTTNNYSSPSTRTSDSVLALDMASGRIAWSIQIEANDAWNGGCVSPNTAVLCPKQHGNDLGVGANTVLATTSDGRDLVVAGDKSGWVVAVDAESGAVAWKSKVGRGGMLAGVHFGLAANGDRVFVPVADSEDGQSHSEPARPGLYALDLRTGRSVWKAPDDHVDCRGRPPGCAPGLDAGLLVTSDMVIAGAIDGTLRAYDIQSGKIVWMFDMTRSTQTLGGGQAHGGSMGGAVAPVAYDGALYVLSGYGFGGKMPGNAMFMLEASH